MNDVLVVFDCDRVQNTNRPMNDSIRLIFAPIKMSFHVPPKDSSDGDHIKGSLIRKKGTEEDEVMFGSGH